VYEFCDMWGEGGIVETVDDKEIGWECDGRGRLYSWQRAGSRMVAWAGRWRGLVSAKEVNACLVAPK
jgi:hypothetical protein